MSNIERSVRVINEDDEKKDQPIQKFVVGVDHAGQPLQVVMSSSGKITMSGVFGTAGIKDVYINPDISDISPAQQVEETKKRRRPHMPNLAMVSSYELRRGNIVYVADEWDNETATPYVPTGWTNFKYQVVDRIDGSDCINTFQKDDTNETDVNEIQDVMAVKLDGSRLEMLGFKKRADRSDVWYDSNHLTKFNLLYVPIDRSWLVCDIDRNLNIVNEPIKHVHQLQNVYFTLTACELDVALLK